MATYCTPTLPPPYPFTQLAVTLSAPWTIATKAAPSIAGPAVVTPVTSLDLTFGDP